MFKVLFDMARNYELLTYEFPSNVRILVLIKLTIRCGNCYKQAVYLQFLLYHLARERGPAPMVTQGKGQVLGRGTFKM
jgi:hypothetical protein